MAVRFDVLDAMSFLVPLCIATKRVSAGPMASSARPGDTVPSSARCRSRVLYTSTGSPLSLCTTTTMSPGHACAADAGSASAGTGPAAWQPTRIAAATTDAAVTNGVRMIMWGSCASWTSSAPGDAAVSHAKDGVVRASPPLPSGGGQGTATALPLASAQQVAPRRRAT